MTSPAEPASTDATQASQLTKPLRELGALVLLGANAVLLFVALLRLLLPTSAYSTFTGRAGSTFFSFVGVESTALPILAVLLATHVRPVLPRAKLITQVALVEYAVGALFGALTFLISAVGRLAEGEVLDALLGMLTRAAWLAIFAVAAYVVWTIWRRLYYTPKPKPQPGVYGQAQPGWPQQGHPGQGGYPAPGHPGQGGYPAPGQPGGYPAPGQPGYPAPGGWPTVGGHPATGQPGAHPVPGQYGHPVPPQSAPPYTPASAPPNTAPPFGQPPSADPTQAIPRQPAEHGQPGGHPGEESDRTQRLDRDDPNHPR